MPTGTDIPWRSWFDIQSLEVEATLKGRVSRWCEGCRCCLGHVPAEIWFVQHSWSWKCSWSHQALLQIVSRPCTVKIGFKLCSWNMFSKFVWMIGLTWRKKKIRSWKLTPHNLTCLATPIFIWGERPWSWTHVWWKRFASKRIWSVSMATSKELLQMRPWHWGVENSPAKVAGKIWKVLERWQICE